jgi:cation transport regulator ChaC
VQEYVFGYGSLVVRDGSFVAQLAGYRRAWRVAMDNRVDLPGYKYFVDAATGERPDAMVAFLDLAEDPETTVNGVVFPTDDLTALDARERNYARLDVTAAVHPAPQDGRVWAYIGTLEAKKRFETGPTIVSRAYMEQVRAAFGTLGPTELATYDRTTDSPRAAVRDLQRIDLSSE